MNTKHIDMIKKFTQGDWRFSKNLELITTSRLGIAEGSKTICDLNRHVGFTNEEEMIANANLIAASPTMLDALIEAQKELEYHNWANTATYNQVTRAIIFALKGDEYDEFELVRGMPVLKYRNQSPQSRTVAYVSKVIDKNTVRVNDNKDFSGVSVNVNINDLIF